MIGKYMFYMLENDAYDQTQIRKECRSERHKLHRGCNGEGA